MNINALSLLLISLLLSQAVIAQDLLGKIDGHVYTDKEDNFTTRLPSLEGELRDFSNAVSVYNVLLGSQDSLEYYPIPAEEMERYKQLGPEQYHTGFMRRAIINGRYKDNFNEVKVVSEEMQTVDEHPLFLTTIEVPGGSQIMDVNGNKKDLWVALGSTIHKGNIYVYQVAVTFIGQYVPKELTRDIKQRLINWASNTNYSS